MILSPLWHSWGIKCSGGYLRDFEFMRKPFLASAFEIDSRWTFSIFAMPNTQGHVTLQILLLVLLFLVSWTVSGVKWTYFETLESSNFPLDPKLSKV